MNDSSDTNDARIRALRVRAWEAWQRRQVLMRNSWVLLISGVVAVVASTLLGDVLGPALTLLLFGLGLLLLIAGMVWVVLTIRARFTVEQINDGIVKIDPSRRVVDSIPEQLGRRLRAAIDERRQS